MTSPDRVVPERVVVVGASGFGRECLDVLEAMAAAGSPVEVAGVVADRRVGVDVDVPAEPHVGREGRTRAHDDPLPQDDACAEGGARVDGREWPYTGILETVH